jgi:hypothetical protein
MPCWTTFGFRSVQQAMSGDDATESPLPRKWSDNVLERTARSEASPERTTESGFSDLPAVSRGDLEFRASLTLSVHNQIGQPPFSLKARDWQMFTDVKGEKTPMIASVVAML